MSSKSTAAGRRAPVQRRARATVASLLDAAAAVVVDRGVSGAGTGKIAAAAGVSVGALYEYFPNKDALLAALVARRLEEIAVDRRLALDAASADAADAVVTALVRAELAARTGAPLDSALFGAVPPSAQAAVEDAEARLAELVTERLLGLPGVRAAGGTAALDEDAFVHALASLIRGLLGGPSEAPQLGVGGGPGW